jgi:small subunit ribosomal protein S16
MLTIRFLRRGKKNQPFFKIVVTDKRRAPRGGRFVEQVGFLNPLTKEKKLKAERLKYWLSVGAKPSASIHNFLVQEKILTAEKIPLHKKKKTKGEEKKEKPKEPLTST